MGMRYYNKSLASLLLLEDDAVLAISPFQTALESLSEQGKKRITKILTYTDGSTKGGIAERIVEIIVGGINTNPVFADDSPFVDIESEGVYYNVKGSEAGTSLNQVLKNSTNIGQAQFNKFFNNDDRLDKRISLLCVSYNRRSGNLEFLEYGPTLARIIKENFQKSGVKDIRSHSAAEKVFQYSYRDAKKNIAPNRKLAISLKPTGVRRGTELPQAKKAHSKVRSRLEDVLFSRSDNELIDAIDKIAAALKSSRDDIRSNKEGSPFKD